MLISSNVGLFLTVAWLLALTASAAASNDNFDDDGTDAWLSALLQLLQQPPPAAAAAPPQQQQPHPFVCRSGAVLPDAARLLCDGRIDCHDGSDESRALCARTMCPSGTWRCHYGACVPRGRRCDGVRDCADGSDEEACGRRRGSCAQHEFRCKRTGRCVAANRVCDGRRDCAPIDYLHDDDDEDDYQTGSSDEASALCDVPALCPRDAFRCAYGGCVPAAAQCDGHADCLDASDESGVLCAAGDEADCGGTDCWRAIRCAALDVERLDAVCELDAETTTTTERRRVPEGNFVRRRMMTTSGVVGAAGGMAPTRVACDQPVPVGTVATYSCSEFFEPASARHQHNDQTRCQRDGTWTRDPLRCRPVCGRRFVAAAVPLVVRGQAVERPFPWHVSMYVQTAPPSSTTSEGPAASAFRFWCGATLITERVVLTAAHCVWGVQADALRLVIGATSSHYFDDEAAADTNNTSNDTSTTATDDTNDSDADSNPYERTLRVRRIRMHPLYQDRYGNFGSDIAALELTGAVPLTADALPACIDWHLDDIDEHLAHRQLGHVMGMGVTEAAAFADRMRRTALPVVEHGRCLAVQRRDFRKYVTHTTFCAGWANGTGVCNGDSGGGLVFRSRPPAAVLASGRGSDVGTIDDGDDDGGVWYLQGIVSLSPRSPQTQTQCDPYAYTIFTKVGMYVEWIRHQVDAVHGPLQRVQHGN